MHLKRIEPVTEKAQAQQNLQKVLSRVIRLPYTFNRITDHRGKNQLRGRLGNRTSFSTCYTRNRSAFVLHCNLKGFGSTVTNRPEDLIQYLSISREQNHCILIFLRLEKYDTRNTGFRTRQTWFQIPPCSIYKMGVCDRFCFLL